jgi:alkylation response protein AidB-like acyl-CoA dehydrogenase
MTTATTAVPDLTEFRRFFRDEFERAAAQIEATDRVPDELLRSTAALGAYRLTAPAELGGFGLPAASYLPYLEAAATGPGAGRMLVHVNNGLWRPLVRFGDARAVEVARELVAGESCVAFALTEQTAGTGRDLRSLAVRDGSGWRVSGEKHLITFGDRADFFILVVASDERRAKDSLTAFLIPRDTPGLEVDADQRTMGLHGTGHAWLRYDGMPVDDGLRLGAVGQGLEVATAFLVYSRLSLSTSMVGLGQRALDEAVAFAQRRRTFGRPIGERQAIQAHLADMQADLSAGRALVQSIAAAYDAGEDVTARASAAKLFCLNMVGRVTDLSLRVHGGYGYTTDAAIERIYRDARGFWFEEGTQEIQQLIVARDVLGAPA